MKNWILSLALLLILPGLALAVEAPRLTVIFAETHENQSNYGNAIKLFFDQPMNRPNWTDPRITSSITIPSAPAGYENNNSARNAAKNYRVIITPAPGSTTQAFTGTWYQAGGKAIYDPQDPELSTVILLPPSKTSPLFQPGDKVRVEVISPITNPLGVPLNIQHNNAEQFAS